MTHYRHSHPKLLTPISHLFNSFASNQLLELSDCLEGRERTIELNFIYSTTSILISILGHRIQLSFCPPKLHCDGLQCITKPQLIAKTL